MQGSMNGEQYKKCLQETLFPGLKKAGVSISDIKFQEDGAPCHTSKMVKAWQHTNHFDLLSWTPNSPDLNIIENLWAILKQQIRERKVRPKNQDELWEAIQEEWYAIPTEIIEHLYASLPQRMSDVIDAKGWYTRY